MTLKHRTKEFAVRVVRLAESVAEKSWAAKRIADQLLRAGTSVGAHYAEALGARSDAEFIAKIDGGLQELREALYWIDLAVTLGFLITCTGKLSVTITQAFSLPLRG
jgi:four helix bundle protein